MKVKSIVRRAPVSLWTSFMEHLYKWLGKKPYGVKPLEVKPLEVKPPKPSNAMVEYSATLSRSMNAWNFEHTGSIDFNTYNVIGELRSKVYIYNISEQTHDVSNPFIKNGKVLGRKEGEEYTLYTSIPEIIRVAKQCVETDTTGFFVEDGKRIAMDLINPDNLGLDQTQDVCFSSDGRNLGKRGLFWSLNNPPTCGEVSAAKERMVAHYTKTIERIDTLEFLFVNSEEGSKEQRIAKTAFKESVTPEARTAAKHLGLVRSWHQPIFTQETQNS